MQIRMAGRSWSTVVESSDSALMVSDVAAVVRLAVVLEGHLNIVCSYQEQAARTWVPAVVHVHGCSFVDKCLIMARQTTYIIIRSAIS